MGWPVVPRREATYVYRHWRLLPVLVVALAGLSYPGGAATPSVPPILTLDQVRPGMTGYGLTVIHGTKIDRFRVRIVGILRGGQSSDLILFRATGPVIDEAGGTAAGMSGSPIYVDDRLIGALSYGYKFAGQDADLSLATPIEDMLKLLGAAPARETAGSPRLYEAAQPFPAPAGLISRVLLMRSAADASATASLRSPVIVYNSEEGCSPPACFWLFGGTSASTQIISAVFALGGSAANYGQGASYVWKHRTNNVYDVTQGNNLDPRLGVICASHVTYICTARYGFDGPTGLGTPRGIGAF